METNQAVRALGALAQASRLGIFRLLVEAGPVGMAAGQIAEQLGIAPSSLSFHMKELTHAELVTVEQRGRFMIYAANYAQMNALMGFLTENCCAGQACAATEAPACARPLPLPADPARHVQLTRHGARPPPPRPPSAASNAT